MCWRIFLCLFLGDKNIRCHFEIWFPKKENNYIFSVANYIKYTKKTQFCVYLLTDNYIFRKQGERRTSSEPIRVLLIRDHKWIYFFHWLECTVTLISNFLCLKLFSIRVKNIWAYRKNKQKTKTKRKQNKRKTEKMGFALLKAFSWETDLWVNLWDFTIKQILNWKEKVTEKDEGISKIRKNNMRWWA